MSISLLLPKQHTVTIQGQGTNQRKRAMMQIRDELRKRQLAITGDFKARGEKAEKLLGEIEACETKLSELSEALSSVLYIEVMQAAVAAKVPRAKAAKVKSAKVKLAKTAKVNPAAKRNETASLKDRVRDFLVKAGKPMRIAEIVSAMKKAGHVFQAKKPVAAMSLLLYTHNKVFKKVNPGTFAVMGA